jgi:mannosyltransferase OCH1-like enzyme/glycosyltransferase involved in cell wall biosynthesis
VKIAFIVQNLAQVSDSVGYDCLYQYRVARDIYPQEGDVRIFADVFKQSLHPDVLIEPFKDFWAYTEEFPDATIVYHFCDGWDKVDDFLRDNGRNVIVRWHNNTPPWFYAGSNIDFAAGCNRGFDIASRFAQAGSVRFMVNSEFTRRQLHALGGRDALIDTVFPASGFLQKSFDEEGARPLPDATSRPISLLFVSRVVPHKGHRHVLSVAAAVQRFSGRAVRVIFAGSLENRLEDYWSDLPEIAARLGVQLEMPGLVSDAEVSDLYHSCDAFVCMSEHEGFGMPVFEAMRCHLPVVAWSNSAMGDLLAGHPFASSEFNLYRFAACVLAACEPGIRSRVIGLQHEILQGYTNKSVSAQLRAALARMAGENADAPGFVSAKPVEEIDSFVASLGDWIEAELGSSIETFVHDASVNYVSLYDLKVFDRLIGYTRSGGQVVLGDLDSGNAVDLDELHAGHEIIRHLMQGGDTGDTRPLRNLEELLSFDDEVFLRLAFRSLIGREIDDGALSAYLIRIRAGENKTVIARELASSDEGRAHGGPFSEEARAAHPPEGATQFQEIETRIDRLHRFLVPSLGAMPPYHPLGSIHHVNDLVRLNSVAFIDMSYRTLLGRAADPGGMNYYVEALRNGMPRRRFLTNLAETETGKQRVGNLEGLADYLTHRDAEPPIGHDGGVSTTAARLGNNIGQLMNQLVVRGPAVRTDQDISTSVKSLLRLTEQALREQSVGDFAAMRATAIENLAFQGAAEARRISTSIEALPRSDETRFAHVHQIFITEDGQLPESFPELVQHNIDSLRRLHPEAAYRLWGTDDLRQFIAAHFEREVVEAFDTLQAFALKADLGRYCLLYVYGGLYSDLSNRFLSRWRLPAESAIACFREHKPLHGALWMNQNTIIYAAPGEPEIRLAIDLVLDNVRNLDYGVSSLAPSGPVLFGRIFAALGRVGSYHIGEAVNVQVEGALNRANYINRDGSLIAARLQGGGGRPSDVGLRGTNVYGEMWERREIYGEGQLLFPHDDLRIKTDAACDASGIHLRDGGAELAVLAVSLPRGLYTATCRFAPLGLSGRLNVGVRQANGEWVVRDSHSPDPVGDVQVAFRIESAAEVDVLIRGDDRFKGLFKQIVIHRVSQDPGDSAALPPARTAREEVAAKPDLETNIDYIHHIVYENADLESGDADIIKENLRLAAALHVNAKQMLWTDSSLREFIASRFAADAVMAYDNFKHFTNRAEFGRYCLLYALGGLYVDPWLRMVNPIDVPRGKNIACFRTSDVEEGASWAADTALIYSAPNQVELQQIIDQILQTTFGGDYGAVPSSITGAERFGRVLAVNYDARRYFGGEAVPVGRGGAVDNACFFSQDGRLIAVRQGINNPMSRAQHRQRVAWSGKDIYVQQQRTEIVTD